MGSQTWVWKMSWAASTALVRIWRGELHRELGALDRHDDAESGRWPCRSASACEAGGGVVLRVVERCERVAEHAGRSRRRSRRAPGRAPRPTPMCHSGAGCRRWTLGSIGASAEDVEGPVNIYLAGLHRGHVGLVGARGVIRSTISVTGLTFGIVT